MDIRSVRLTDPDAGLLIAAVQAEYVERYGGPDETPVDATEFDAPEGAFFVGYLDGGPVAMGGWRRHRHLIVLDRTRAAEVKRMYVVPAVRGRGLARAMLAHLEDSARDVGADVMVLETGERQPEAISLYQSSGYEPIAGFGFYKDAALSRSFARRL